jgi:hypothetical protein
VSKDQAKTSRNAAQEQAKASWRATWLQKLKNRSTGTTATKPLGIAVSQALTLPSVGDINHDAAEHALQLIDQVHGDGLLPQSSIGSKDLGQRVYGETIYRDQRGQNAGVQINLTSGALRNIPMITTMHEVGHFLDCSALPGVGLTTERDEKELKRLLAGWRKAVYNSQGFKQLAIPGMDDDMYLRKDRELFARSYAQFIATKIADPAALKELDWMREHDPLSVWSQEDFKPIAKALEALCKKQKWLV